MIKNADHYTSRTSHPTILDADHAWRSLTWLIVREPLFQCGRKSFFIVQGAPETSRGQQIFALIYVNRQGFIRKKYHCKGHMHREKSTQVRRPHNCDFLFWNSYILGLPGKISPFWYQSQCPYLEITTFYWLLFQDYLVSQMFSKLCFCRLGLNMYQKKNGVCLDFHISLYA